MFASTMLPQLAVATLMVFATVMIHLIGVTTLARLLRFDPKAEEHHHQFTPRVALLVLAVVLALVLLHGIEIWIYAGLYLYLDAVTDLETAVYFSTIHLCCDRIWRQRNGAAVAPGERDRGRQWRIAARLVDRFLRQCCRPSPPLTSDPRGWRDRRSRSIALIRSLILRGDNETRPPLERRRMSASPLRGTPRDRAGRSHIAWLSQACRGAGPSSDTRR